MNVLEQTAEMQIMGGPAVRSIRVMLINDQTMVRAGLRMLLQSWPGIEVVGDSGLSASAVESVEQTKPDIVLVDFDVTRNGQSLEFLRQVQVAVGNGKTIVLTAERDSKMRLRVVRAGAMGIVMKERAVEELQKAISKVHSGELWLDRSLMAEIISETLRNPSLDKPDKETEMIQSLTQREREVCELVCEGLRNEEIGKRLSISETTVRHHLTSAFSKLEVSSRFELMILLYRKHFVTPPLYAGKLSD